jgi:sugar phosphate isomerase/epimerase
MNIKIGACDWALPGGGLYAPRIAFDIGLTCLALKIGLYERNYPVAEPEMQKYYLEEQQKYGIEYVAIALNDFDNICIYSRPGTAEYDIVCTVLSKGVSSAKSLGIPVIQVPGFSKSAIRCEEDIERTAVALRYLCDIAGECGITVASENLLTPDEFKLLASMVNRDNFKVYYDSQNYFLFKGYDQVEILDGLYNLMVPQLHVKDGNGAMSGSLLGKGNSNFYGTIDALKKNSFEGCILLENYYDQLPLRLENESPYELLRQDVAILKAALK